MDALLHIESRYGLNPLIFASIYFGSIPFFLGFLGWFLKHLRNGRVHSIALTGTLLFYFASYLYMFMAGRHLPNWLTGIAAGVITASLGAVAVRIGGAWRQRIGIGGNTLDHQSVENAYRRLAPTYDRLFGPIFEPGRQTVVEKMACHPGDSVLEVGVGTGLSLPIYPHGVKVTGIDLSRHMLEKAKKRVAKLNPCEVALHQMDAQHLAFPDNSFDKVVAMYVVTVVPDLAAVLSEMKRVCRPGGDLFFVNHFGHESGVLHGLEGALAPFSKLLGFRTDLTQREFLAEANLDVLDTRSVNFFDYWTLIHASNR